MNTSIFLEHKEVYKGLPLQVHLIYTGHRCGYVGVTELDDYNEQCNYDYEVHGGITWSNTRKEFENCFKIKVHPAIKYVLGFDTSHSYDKPDTKLAQEVFEYKIPSILLDDSITNGSIRSTEYCINECKLLIDQILEH